MRGFRHAVAQRHAAGSSFLLVPAAAACVALAEPIVPAAPTSTGPETRARTPRAAQALHGVLPRARRQRRAAPAQPRLLLPAAGLAADLGRARQPRAQHRPAAGALRHRRGVGHPAGDVHRQPRVGGLWRLLRDRVGDLELARRSVARAGGGRLRACSRRSPGRPGPCSTTRSARRSSRRPSASSAWPRAPSPTWRVAPPADPRGGASPGCSASAVGPLSPAARLRPPGTL